MSSSPSPEVENNISFYSSISQSCGLRSVGACNWPVWAVFREGLGIGGPPRKFCFGSKLSKMLSPSVSVDIMCISQHINSNISLEGTAPITNNAK